MNDRESITRKLFRNASWLFGGKVAAGVFSAIQTVVLARSLGVNQYGLLVLIIAYVDVLNNFFDWRTWETATKYIGDYWAKRETEKTRSMIKLSYVIDIATGIVAFAVAVLTAKLAVSLFIKTTGADSFIYIYSLSLLISTSNNTSDAILRVFNKFKEIAFVSSVTNFIRLGLIVLVLFKGMGVGTVLFCYIGAAFFGFVARLWFVRSAVVENGLGPWWRSRLSEIRGQWREIAWFLGNTSFVGTLSMANGQHIAPLMLGFFSGKEAVAYYKVARSATKLVIRIVDPFYEAIYPEFVRTVAENVLRDFKRLILDSTKYLAVVLVPITVVFVVFAEPILRLIFGVEYASAAPALRVVALAMLVNQITFWINPAFLALGKPGLRTYVAVVSTVAYVLLLFILVPGHSFVGAAWALAGFAVVKAAISLLSLSAVYRGRKRGVGVGAADSE